MSSTDRCGQNSQEFVLRSPNMADVRVESTQAITPVVKYGRLRKLIMPECDVWYNVHHRWIVAMQRIGNGCVRVYPDVQTAEYQLGVSRVMLLERAPVEVGLDGG
jgi:hypothetical protein